MTLGAWRTAYASASGTSHARTGAPCQDAGRCEVVVAEDGGEVLIASVSDGAGSAPRSEHGARLAVASFHRAFAGLARSKPGLGFLDEACARAWLAALQAEIAALADGAPSADYACTFLGAVVGPSAAVFLQVGDGAIVVGVEAGAEAATEDGAEDGAEEGHEWVFWPQHGEFANSTFFVTMAEADQVLAFARRDGAVRELAMFSDGLERLILDMRAQTVHSPSLRPILRWLAGQPPSDGAPSPVLAAYLDSANVNRRTDDDKTLVMATRAGA